MMIGSAMATVEEELVAQFQLFAFLNDDDDDDDGYDYDGDDGNAMARSDRTFKQIFSIFNWMAAATVQSVLCACIMKIKCALYPFIESEKKKDNFN